MAEAGRLNRQACDLVRLAQAVFAAGAYRHAAETRVLQVPIWVRFGAGRTALTCAALSAIVLALIGWTQNVYLWFPLRFLIGVVTNQLYVLSETWVIALAPPARRGRVMGSIPQPFRLASRPGRFCLLAVGTEGWPPFLVGIAAFVFCGACLTLVQGRLPKFDEAGH